MKHTGTGMNEPPDIAGFCRPYAQHASCPATNHVSDLVLRAIEQGMCPVLPPLEDEIKTKLLVQGVTVEDVLNLTVADVRQSMEDFRAFRQSKGPHGKFRWTPVWLKLVIIAKKEKAWEQEKANHRREAQNMPQAIKSLADQVGHLPDDQQRDFLWGAMDPIEKTGLIRGIRETLGVGMSPGKIEQVAKTQWWEARR